MAAVVVAFAACRALAAQPADCVMSVRLAEEPTAASQGVDVRGKGLNVELMREALRRVGCAPQYRVMPWKRALHELEDGTLQVLPDAFRLPERERYAHFSRPFIRARNVVYMSRESAGRYRLGSLAEVRGTKALIGAVIGASYGPEYDALMKDPAFAARIVMVAQRLQAWRMIAAGRLDGVIAEETWGLQDLRELGLADSIVKTPVVVSDMPAMIAFSKRTVTREFVVRFDEALGAMMADGTYRQILERNLPCSVSVKRLGCE